MTPTLLFVFAVIVVSASTDTRFLLRRVSDEQERMTVMAHAGHPTRLFPLTLSFTVPPAFDAAGPYAGVVVTDGDPVQREWRRGTLGSTGLLDLPTLRLESLGEEHFWPVNTTHHPARQLGVPPAPNSRGFLLLGAGSAVWLRHRYAHIRRTQLVLTNTPPPTGHQLPCVARDAVGRCVLTNDGYTLRQTLRTGTANVVTSRGRIILDLDRYATTLPANLTARLRRAADHTSDPGGTVQVHWGPLLVAHATAFHASALQSLGGTAYVAAGTGSDDIILGRELLTRLFSEMTYDSHAATWVGLAAVSDTEVYTEAVRWTMVVLLWIQALLVGRQLLSPTHLMLADILRPTLRRQGRSRESTTHVLPMSFVALVIVVAILQCVLGQVYVGHGFGVDPVRAAALAKFGWWVLGMGCAYVALLGAAWFFMLRVWYMWSLEFLASMAYLNLGLCGLLVSLLPRAAQSTVELVLVCTLVVLELFLLSYYIMASLVILIIRWFLRPANPIAVRTNTLWAFVFAGAVVMYSLLTYASWTSVLGETARAFNTQQSVDVEAGFGTAVIALTFLASGFLVRAESQACFEEFILGAKETN